MSTTPHTSPVAQLKATLAFAKAHQADGSMIHVTDTGGWPRTYTGAAYRRWFRECLMRKIDREAPASRGRKDCRNWFMEQWRASRELNQPRLVIHWLPPNLAARFPHRLRRNMED